MTITTKNIRIVIFASLLVTTLFAKNAFSVEPIFVDAENVEFNSAPYTYKPSPFKVKQAKKQGKTLEVKIEPSVSLTGYLSRPSGDGPRAAIVLLHSCAGLSEFDEMWSDRLVSWGYVVLTVDSFKPRGLEHTCEEEKVTPWARALDAYGAKQFLSSHSFVDSKRIAVMGRSHGGRTVFEIIKQSISEDLATNPFQAAIALYPYCREPVLISTPTLIMSGGKDQGNPAELCEQYLKNSPPQNEITLKVFAGAYHAFDQPGVDGLEAGYIVRYNQEAAAKANELARKFLGERL